AEDGIRDRNVTGVQTCALPILHAVEDYIMSRYQMYWQVYFHPVTRSAEVILMKILHRAKYLFGTHYRFKSNPSHFISLFKENVRSEERRVGKECRMRCGGTG